MLQPCSLRMSGSCYLFAVSVIHCRQRIARRSAIDPNYQNFDASSLIRSRQRQE